MTPDEIKAIVQKAARVCAETKPPTKSTAEVGDYAAVITRGEKEGGKKGQVRFS